MSEPVIDYTARDFDGYVTALNAYAALVMPQYTTLGNTGDFGTLFRDWMAYIGDIQSYYQDRSAAEAYLGTATLPASVLQLAALLGYSPAPALAATTTVTLASDPSASAAIDVPAGTALVTGFQAARDDVITFETNADVSVPAAGGSATVTVTEGTTAGTYQLTDVSGNVRQVLDLGTSDGSANQSYTLPSAPLLGGTLAVLVQLPAGAVLWNEVADLLTAAPTDAVYSTVLTDTGATSVEFGDAVNGAIPRPAASSRSPTAPGAGPTATSPRTRSSTWPTRSPASPSWPPSPRPAEPTPSRSPPCARTPRGPGAPSTGA